MSENPSHHIPGIFFLVAAAQGLFFAITQVSLRARPKAPRFFLAVIIALFSLSLIESGLWWTESMDHFVHFIMVSEPLTFLYGPLFYFYIKSSFTSYQFQKKDLVHFIPFFLSFSYCAQFYFNSTASKAAMMKNEILFSDFFKVDIDPVITISLMVVSLVSYAFYAWKQFCHHTRILSEVRNWFLMSFGVFVFYIVGLISFHVLVNYKLMDGCADYGIAFTTSLFIYLFSWFGFVRPRIFEGYSLQESLQPNFVSKYKSSVLTNDLVNELTQVLQETMQTEKLYRNEDIRLDVLANSLGVSRNSVSQVINSTGMNFFEYINHWRIEDAKKILMESNKKELNIIEVAYEVGFNNKVTFNKSFKKSTGLTPTEFRKLAAQKLITD